MLVRSPLLAAIWGATSTSGIRHQLLTVNSSQPVVIATTTGLDGAQLPQLRKLAGRQERAHVTIEHGRQVAMPGKWDGIGVIWIVSTTVVRWLVSLWVAVRGLW